VPHHCIIYPPLLGIQSVPGFERQLFYLVVTRSVSVELCLVVSGSELLVVIASDIRCPVVVNVDISAAEQVGLFLGKMYIGDLPGHLLPVLEGDVPDTLSGLKLILIRQWIRLVDSTVVVIWVVVALETVLVSSSIVRKPPIVDLKKLGRLAIRMVKEQFDAAEVRELLV
jgi:hypothetical protein